MIHLLSLNPALDLFLDFESSGSGKVGKINEASVQAGGKALNLARFLKKYKIPATTWLGTGGGEDPTHLFFRALLEREKLRVHFLGGRSPVRFTAVLREGKFERKFNHAGFEMDLAFFDSLMASVKKNDFLVLTGRLPEGMNDSLYGSWIKAFQRRGIHVALDSSGPALEKGLLGHPWFFKVNLFEFSGALGIPLGNLRKLSKLLPKLIRSGLLHGAVTNGAEGALVWNGPEAYWVRSSNKITGRLVVGAGDGFLAGYLRGFRARKSLKGCALLACATGAAVAQGGIMGFDPDLSSKTLKKLKIKKI